MTLTGDQATSAFLKCVGTGRLDAVRALLAAAPSLVNAAGPHPFWGGRPQPLHVAIEGRRRDMFDVLLEHGADVNGANDTYDHWSPLMLAINRDQAGMRDALLERGARVGLVEALLLGDDARVETLLSSGPLPDVVPNRASLLAFARTPVAIDRLIALGASPTLADRWGATPIEAISRLGARGDDLVRHLVARGVPASPKEYARLGDRKMLDTLVQADPAIAALDAVVMAAVDGSHHDLVAWLLQVGGHVNARSDAATRHTALHSAAWNGDLDMVRLLLDHGADPTLRDDQYHATAQGWAETSIQVSNNPRCVEVAAFLAGLPAR